ncbi:MAG: hypothetical protein EHM28_08980 [Spirochaetaceae bacterium]|nr:MAG: hypothetical protein EHM28_08980 [Spirochaetaceae bacterium]
MLEKFDISNWTPGTSRTIYEHPRFRFITPICFEDVFPDDIRRFVLEDVDVIVNISNDYWSLSPAEGRQHGIFGLFRAVENRRPMVRSTSSGYTVACDAVGRIMPGSPEPYTENYQVAKIPLSSRELTLYTLWGDWFPWFCLVTGVLSIAIVQIIKYSGKKKD